MRKQLTEQHKRNISEGCKGIPKSEEHKKKTGMAQKGRKHKPQEGFQKGHKPFEGAFDKDSRHTEKSKRLIGDANQCGELARNWQGGLSFEPYSVDWTETLKRSIRERDNYICQLCNQYGNAVHHIDYNKKNCNPSNLITLCIRCNSRVNAKREYWTRYFQEKL